MPKNLSAVRRKPKSLDRDGRIGRRRQRLAGLDVPKRNLAIGPADDQRFSILGECGRGPTPMADQSVRFLTIRNLPKDAMAKRIARQDLLAICRETECHRE